MGLDMYALKKKEDSEPEEFFYWRKHPDLHGWMEKKWRDRGNEGEFNCVPVELDDDDLDELESAIHRSRLPNTSGFFFGASHPDDKENDLSFVKQARDALRTGYQVAYSSWW